MNFPFHLKKKKKRLVIIATCFGEDFSKLKDVMLLFVALQRNRDTPGLYFSNIFESLHSPQGLKLSVNLRTQQYQYFCIWIISVIS